MLLRLSCSCSLTVTVIVTLLIAVWLLLDGHAGDSSVIGFFSLLYKLTAVKEKERKRGRGREGEKGRRREIALLSVLEQTLPLSGARLAKGKL